MATTERTSLLRVVLNFLSLHKKCNKASTDLGTGVQQASAVTAFSAGARRWLGLICVLALVGATGPVGAQGTAGWVQRGADVVGAQSDDFFGSGVAVSADGNTFVTSAPAASVSGVPSVGQVRVFDWDGVSWVQRGAGVNGLAANNFLGTDGAVAVSEDGSTFIAGSPSPFIGPGYALVFAWDGTSWVQRGSTLFGGALSDSFGVSVAMSADGDSVVVGAEQIRNGGAGFVRVFDWDGVDWVQRGSDIDGVAFEDRFGDSIAVSADRNVVVAGASGADQNGTGSGQVRVFVWDGSAWVQQGSNVNGLAAFDQFGNRVAVSADGLTFVAGARAADVNGFILSGQVSVFDWDGVNWVQRGAALNGIADRDNFGSSVAVSADGNRFAAGSTDSNSPGSVRVFDWDGSVWVENSAGIVGTQVESDRFGFSVGLSADGVTLVAGALGVDTVQVYGFVPSLPAIEHFALSSVTAANAAAYSVTG